VAIPTVNPAQARWEDDLDRACEARAPAVRVYPQYHGLDAAAGEMRVFASAAAMAKMPVIFAVRLEDVRQRHPLDHGDDLPAAAVRQLVRGERDLRALVTHASREFVEEVHFGLTPDEAQRVLWDVSWIWGPPEDHLALLLETVGPERFTFGTGMPLRIPDAALAKLELLDLDERAFDAMMGGNLEAWLRS
jgi:predicted TIM-barrel fold metal-dependent hydrolase